MIVDSPKYGKITLADTPFSSGAEGAVYKITSPQHLMVNCVKIYKKPTQQRADKIKFMVDNPPAQIERPGIKIGWALDSILQNNKFIGFMMPLAFPDSKELVSLTSAKISKNLDASWQKYDRRHGKAALVARLKLMNNIAIPIHLLHQTGKYVLRDFKPQNVLVTHSGQVTICDMDSIQIAEGKTMRFHGSANTPEYTPPEHANNSVGKSTADVLEQSWDSFALAVVFYQLLFGLHPYTGTPKVQKDANSSDVSQNISDDLFPYGNNRHKMAIIPKPHEKFTVLPQPIQELFRRSFSLNAANRPSANEWGEKLHEIIKNVGTIPPITVTPPPALPVPPKPPKPPTPTPNPPKPPVPSSIKLFICGMVIIIVAVVIYLLMQNGTSLVYNDNDNDSAYNILPEMVYVEGGTFTMGCTGEQGYDCDDNERPNHAVYVSSFKIGKYEVTQKLWNDVMSYNPSTHKGDNFPVENVSYREIQEFINNLNNKTGKNFRLPTEAEWEYAARGGIRSKEYKYSGSNDINAVAWYNGNTYETHEVGTKQPNELEIYDMSGNVDEWCQDWDYSYKINSRGSDKIFRGGSIYREDGKDSADDCRVSARRWLNPDANHFSLGFRLACNNE